MASNLLDQQYNGQIKLREISLYNWGSFAGLHTAHIDPNGTLITGDNGAGKSTLIDGLMALLMPPSKANFNIAAAQNDRADRTILSYMRGSYGQEHDGTTTATKSKRNKDVITGLRAYYTQDDSTQNDNTQGDNTQHNQANIKGNDITLIALFWADSTATSASDVKRVYLVANHNVKLQSVLAEFNRSFDRNFRAWLENNRIDATQTFDDYQKKYQDLLQMGNKNAPALLSRALGLKKIDNLTDLIRTLVLEPSNLKDDARAIVEEFQNLKKEHDILIDAREQVQRLEQLPSLAKKITQTKQELDELKTLREAVPIYLAKIEQQILEQQLDQLELDYQAIDKHIEENQQALEQTQKSVNDYRDQYMKFGGSQLEQLKREIAFTKDGLRRTSKNASDYQQLCDILGIAKDLTQTTFTQHQQQAIDSQEVLKDQYTTAQDEFGLATGRFSQTRQELSSVKNEIEQIRQRQDSNIPLLLQKWRDALCQELNLSKDTKFIGEMLDIEDSHTAWQGAIERALGGLKATLLVSHSNYPSVTRYINTQRYTGLHLRVQVVSDLSSNLFSNIEATQFLADGFLTKLKWRDHPYQNWLKAFLKKYDLTCVDTTEELDNTPFSMTINGLIHKEKGRFEKKDIDKIDDKHQWQLGFNNQSLLNSLIQRQSGLTEQLTEQKKQLTQSRQAMDNIKDLQQNWQRLLNTYWDDINTPFWQHQLELQEAELLKIQNAQGDMAKFENLYNQARQQLKQLDSQKSELTLQKGAKSQQLETLKFMITQNEILANQMLDETISEKLDKKLRQTNDVSNLKSQLNGEIETTNNRINRDTKSAIGIMHSFKGNEKWQPITADWQATEEGIPDFVAHHAKLVSEGLGKLTEKFKSRMNNRLTQSLVKLKTDMKSEHEKIKHGIEQVNLVLRKTEFRQGTHLKIQIKSETFVHVAQFNQKLKSLNELMTTEEHEIRFKLLNDINNVLDKASNTATANNVESLRLLDPRYQMSFNAVEFSIDPDTHEEITIDVLSSSSGKSGGEKESFAGIIVAASLAYVLTPTGKDKPIYSTVFLDEAFSNTQESVSRRVLKVFKELNIHINLITPYKNLNLAREAANSLIICERNVNEHESSLTEVTWQDYDRQRNLITQLGTLGVQLNGSQNIEHILSN